MKKADFNDDFGTCSKCKEQTSIVEPCCDAPVYYQGGMISPGSFEEEE